MFKTLWYTIFKLYAEAGLFFYTQKISAIGKDNVPKKGAVLFVVNHTNGLLDPILVSTNTPRITYYLVRAGVFKNPLVNKLLRTINLMPIYRMKDGLKEVSKNTSVFNDCFDILNNQKALMIFPEGSQNKRRTIRSITKGFVRIVFGAIEKYPNLEISIIPVGVTYQNIGQFPCRVAIHYGKSINAMDFYNLADKNDSVKNLKEEVANKLKELSVHISDDKNYDLTIAKLIKNNTDFTEVELINKSILNDDFINNKKKKNYLKPIYYLLILNSLIPWLIWKKVFKKIKEYEFIDTFRFGLGISIFPFFYLLQALAIYYFYTINIAFYYLIFTGITTLIYVKFSPTLSK